MCEALDWTMFGLTFVAGIVAIFSLPAAATVGPFIVGVAAVDPAVNTLRIGKGELTPGECVKEVRGDVAVLVTAGTSSYIDTGMKALQPLSALLDW